MLLIFGSALLFVAIGAIFIAKRRELAHLQALLAGGSVVPGCAVAEGIVFFLLALLVVAGYRLGYIP